MKLRVRADYTLLFAIVVVKVCIILAKINILININVLKYYIYFVQLLREKKEYFWLATSSLWSKLKVTSSANERWYQMANYTESPYLGPDWAEIYWRMLHNFPILHCSLSKGMTCCWDELWFYPKTLHCAKKRHDSVLNSSNWDRLWSQQSDSDQFEIHWHQSVEIDLLVIILQQDEFQWLHLASLHFDVFSQFVQDLYFLSQT